jgi:hypothetical protein
MAIAPGFTGEHWAGIGFGLMIMHAARQRQLTRARVKSEDEALQT